MNNVRVIKDEPGAHPGWRNQHFTYRDEEWRLLTVDREGEKTSAIILCGRDRRSYHFDGILSAQGAVEVLRWIDLSFERGREKGAAEVRADIRKALGL